MGVLPRAALARYPLTLSCSLAHTADSGGQHFRWVQIEGKKSSMSDGAASAAAGCAAPGAAFVQPQTLRESREDAAGSHLPLLPGWAALCLIVGFLAGRCYCRGSRSSRQHSGKGCGNGPEKSEVNTPPVWSEVYTPPVRSEVNTLSKGSLHVWHTDSDDTMIHVDPFCRGLRIRTRKLVRRKMCSLCCGSSVVG